MKKIIFCFFILINEIHGQVIPQCGDYSCWAASLAMVSKKVDLFPKNQCQFIQIKEKSDTILCLHCRKEIDCPASPIHEEEMQNITKENLYGYTNKRNLSMSLNHINKLFDKSKPIIYDFRLDGTSSHVVVIDKAENIVFNNNRNISFLKIKDPWPKCVGNEYLMTYERYYIQHQEIEEGGIEARNSGKYTISYIDYTMNNAEIISSDKKYLRNVLYDSTSEGAIGSLIYNLRENTSKFSPDFFRVTNLNKADSLLKKTKITNVFNVMNVNKATIMRDTTFSDGFSSISTLLNIDYNEMISCIAQKVEVCTIISTSKKLLKYPKYEFYNNWVIYHIESGAIFYRNFLEVVNMAQMEINVINNKGLIIRCADTYFAVLKKKEEGIVKYYVYDIYRNGFLKMAKKVQTNVPVTSNTAFMEFTTFRKLLKEYLIKIKQ